jgi:hypothetical protein
MWYHSSASVTRLLCSFPSATEAPKFVDGRESIGQLQTAQHSSGLPILAVAGLAPTVRVWSPNSNAKDVLTEEETEREAEGKSAYKCSLVHQHGKASPVTSMPGHISGLLELIAGLSGPIKCMAMHGEELVVFEGKTNGQMHVIDLRKWRVAQSYPVCEGKSTLQLTPSCAAYDGTSVVCGTEEGYVLVWRWSGNASRFLRPFGASMRGGASPVSSVHISRKNLRDAKGLKARPFVCAVHYRTSGFTSAGAVFGGTRNVVVWDAESGVMLKNYPLKYMPPVLHCALSGTRMGFIHTGVDVIVHEKKPTNVGHPDQTVVHSFDLFEGADASRPANLQSGRASCMSYEGGVLCVGFDTGSVLCWNGMPGKDSEIWRSDDLQTAENGDTVGRRVVGVQRVKCGEAWVVVAVIARGLLLAWDGASGELCGMCQLDHLVSCVSFVNHSERQVLAVGTPNGRVALHGWIYDTSSAPSVSWTQHMEFEEPPASLSPSSACCSSSTCSSSSASKQTKNKKFVLQYDSGLGDARLRGPVPSSFLSPSSSSSSSFSREIDVFDAWYSTDQYLHYHAVHLHQHRKQVDAAATVAAPVRKGGLSGDTKVIKGSVQCDLCERDNGDVFCGDCDMYFCNECCAQYHKPRKLAGHSWDAVVVKTATAAVLTPPPAPAPIPAPVPAPAPVVKTIPVFKWSQDKDSCVFSLSLGYMYDADSLKVTIDPEHFAFHTDKLQLAFRYFTRIDVATSTHVVQNGTLRVFLRKIDVNASFWPHLLDAEDKARLRSKCLVDWDLWTEENDAEEQKILALEQKRKEEMMANYSQFKEHLMEKDRLEERGRAMADKMMKQIDDQVKAKACADRTTAVHASIKEETSAFRAQVVGEGNRRFVVDSDDEGLDDLDY